MGGGRPSRLRCGMCRRACRGSGGGAAAASVTWQRSPPPRGARKPRSSASSHPPRLRCLAALRPPPWERRSCRFIHLATPALVCKDMSFLSQSVPAPHIVVFPLALPAASVGRRRSAWARPPTRLSLPFDGGDDPRGHPIARRRWRRRPVGRGCRRGGGCGCGAGRRPGRGRRRYCRRGRAERGEGGQAGGRAQPPVGARARRSAAANGQTPRGRPPHAHVAAARSSPLAAATERGSEGAVLGGDGDRARTSRARPHPLCEACVGNGVIGRACSRGARRARPARRRDH